MKVIRVSKGTGGVYVWHVAQNAEIILCNMPIQVFESTF